MKVCNKCLLKKELVEFHVASSKKDGRRSQCIACRIAISAAYHKANQTKIAEKSKLYRKKNAEAIRQSKAEYAKNNREHIALYHRTNRTQINARVRRNRETNPLFKLSQTLRGTVYSALTRGGYTKKSRTYQLLGADFATVQAHLIATAVRNYGHYDPETAYHIDHVIPNASATNEEELIKLQHYMNLQLLYPADNLKKGSK